MNALVTIREGEVRANSQDVAAAFEKVHKNVLKAIDNLIRSLPEPNRLNFEPITAKDTRGRQQRAYLMDRKAFSMLAMGFTGERAIEWKLKFFDAFERMENALRNSRADDDNPMASLHPLLQSAEGRDALWRGREQVRLMKELRGRDAAMALWIDMGLPLPRNFDELMEHGSKKQLQSKSEMLPVGEMHAWVTAKQVRANPANPTATDMLYVSYFNWCAESDLAPYGIEKFAKHLRIHFGAPTELKRGKFAIEVGAA